MNSVVSDAVIDIGGAYIIRKLVLQQLKSKKAVLSQGNCAIGLPRVI